MPSASAACVPFAQHQTRGIPGPSQARATIRAPWPGDWPLSVLRDAARRSPRRSATPLGRQQAASSAVEKVDRWRLSSDAHVLGSNQCSEDLDQQLHVRPSALRPQGGLRIERHVIQRAIAFGESAEGEVLRVRERRRAGAPPVPRSAAEVMRRADVDRPDAPPANRRAPAPRRAGGENVIAGGPRVSSSSVSTPLARSDYRRDRAEPALVVGEAVVVAPRGSPRSRAAARRRP